MNLEIVDDAQNIEKGPTKRKMSAKQLANLAKGREVKAANVVARQETRRVENAEKVEKKDSKVEPKVEFLEPEIRRKRTKQVIIFDDNSGSEDEAPKIIIKQKRTQKALPPAEPQPPTPPASPPMAIPIPKLRRV